MISLVSLFHALFMFFDDEKHSFMMNGNFVPVVRIISRLDASLRVITIELRCRTLTHALAFDRYMVALHDGQHRFGNVRELNQAGRGAFRLQREHAHGGRRHFLLVEQLQQLLFGQAGRRVEEVQNLLPQRTTTSD